MENELQGLDESIFKKLILQSFVLLFITKPNDRRSLVDNGPFFNNLFQLEKVCTGTHLFRDLVEQKINSNMDELIHIEKELEGIFRPIQNKINLPIKLKLKKLHKIFGLGAITTLALTGILVTGGGAILIFGGLELLGSGIFKQDVWLFNIEKK